MSIIRKGGKDNILLLEVSFVLIGAFLPQIDSFSLSNLEYTSFCQHFTDKGTLSEEKNE